MDERYTTQCEHCNVIVGKDEVSEGKHVADYTVCESCADIVCGCPNCGELVESDRVVKIPVDYWSPPEYGCPGCSDYAQRQYPDRR